MIESNENRRSLMASLMNWRAYERLLGTENAGKRIIPVGGRFYSPQAVSDALGVLDAVKRDSVLRFHADGVSQAKLALERGVCKSQAWYDVDTGLRAVLSALE